MPSTSITTLKLHQKSMLKSVVPASSSSAAGKTSSSTTTSSSKRPVSGGSLHQRRDFKSLVARRQHDELLQGERAARPTLKELLQGCHVVVAQQQQRSSSSSSSGANTVNSHVAKINAIDRAAMANALDSENCQPASSSSGFVFARPQSFCGSSSSRRSRSVSLSSVMSDDGIGCNNNNNDEMSNSELNTNNNNNNNNDDDDQDMSDCSAAAAPVSRSLPSSPAPSLRVPFSFKRPFSQPPASPTPSCASSAASAFSLMSSFSASSSSCVSASAASAAVLSPAGSPTMTRKRAVLGFDLWASYTTVHGFPNTLMDVLLQRDNVGSVFFPGTTIVSAGHDRESAILQLKKDFDIKQSELLAFVDTPKPAVGVNWNRSSVVRLFNMYPHNVSSSSSTPSSNCSSCASSRAVSPAPMLLSQGDDNNNVGDAEKMMLAPPVPVVKAENSLERYERRLKRKSQNLGADFVSYSEGVWEFTLPHF